ncbi:hypothetical protein [Halococcus saccharolyticus]|uniref:hypothetical protein n=1 Tax=Halococcus saccharolyticus TaxID=62319 RepID=UPI000ADBE2E4|nr:hypothetical protein [Halococcus saccharolyticus]
MSQRQPRARRSTSGGSSDNSSDGGDVVEAEIDRDALTKRGTITCGDVERRRLIEEIGREDEVKFIGDADEAGRQAERDEDWESDLHE